MNSEEIYKLYIQNNTKIETDSRSLDLKDSIFFAIKGKNFDGHDFAEEALEKGAKIAIVENPTKSKDSIVIVKDTIKTLQEIARIHREKYNINVIAITGSNGKTTTKNILSNILSSTYKVFSTKGNFNNHIGLPLTILSLRKEHEIAIIEMGANHIGEITELCNIAQPTHGIITSIGSAHIGEFGSIHNIIKAKNELFNYLKRTNGVIIYNENNDILKNLVDNYKKVNTYQIPEFKHNHNHKLHTFNYQCTPFITIENLDFCEINKIETKIFGKYNINNIIASIKIASIFKVSNEKIKNQLETIKLTNNRSEFIKTKKK